jgi:spermidine/putrescine transport system permease protein
MSGNSSFNWRRTPGLPAFSTLVFLFLYLPLLVVVVFSFNSGKRVTIWEDFSARWYLSVFNNRDIAVALSNSLIIAFASMIASTFIALAAALGLREGTAKNGTNLT